MVAQRDGPDDEPFSIAFNHKYLLDGLKAITTAQVTLLCTFANSPAVFVPFHPPDEAAADGAVVANVPAVSVIPKPGYTTELMGELEYLVMPMQLPSHDASSWAAPGSAGPTTVG